MEKFFYRVKCNDTVSSLSKQFNFPVGLLVCKNNLTKEVEEGDLILIESYKTKLYCVKPLDTAKSVAKKFNLTEKELLEKNMLSYLFYGLEILV